MTQSTLIVRAADCPDQFASLIGDYQHGLDVHLITGKFGPVITRTYLTNEAQARWLKEHYPGLVPGKDPQGNPPSNHQLGSIFECNYNRDIAFRVTYISWLRRQDV